MSRFGLRFCFLILSSSALLLNAKAAYSQSIKVKTIKNISTLLELVPSHSRVLLCINVDEILMAPTQYLGSCSWFLTQRAVIEKKTNSELPLANLEFSHAAVNLLCEKNLLEDELAKILSSLVSETDTQLLGISYKDVSLAESTLDELSERNIDFSGFSLDDSELSFEIFNGSLNLSKTMIFKNGVLFLAKNKTEEGLKNLFQATGFIPKKLLYVSSSLEELTAVGKIFQAFGVDFLGIFYEKNDFLQKIEDSYKLKAANICLSEFSSILTDETIRSILNF